MPFLDVFDTAAHRRRPLPTSEPTASTAARSESDTPVDADRMPSLGEWLAEYRLRPELKKVVLHRVILPEAFTSPLLHRGGIVSLRIVRYDEPQNPTPTGGVYLLSQVADGQSIADTWHEEVDDAFDHAKHEFGASRAAWRAVRESAV
jgi:hypothetical protein